MQMRLGPHGTSKPWARVMATTTGSQRLFPASALLDVVKFDPGRRLVSGHHAIPCLACRAADTRQPTLGLVPATVHVTSPARRPSGYRTGKSVQRVKSDALAWAKRGLTCTQGALRSSKAGRGLFRRRWRTVSVTASAARAHRPTNCSWASIELSPATARAMRTVRTAHSGAKTAV